MLAKGKCFTLPIKELWDRLTIPSTPSSNYLVHYTLITFQETLFEYPFDWSVNTGHDQLPPLLTDHSLWRCGRDCSNSYFVHLGVQCDFSFCGPFLRELLMTVGWPRQQGKPCCLPVLNEKAGPSAQQRSTWADPTPKTKSGWRTALTSILRDILPQMTL